MSSSLLRYPIWNNVSSEKNVLSDKPDQNYEPHDYVLQFCCITIARAHGKAKTAPAFLL